MNRHPLPRETAGANGESLPRRDVGMPHVEIGPGRVTLIEGAPGVGKSALTAQWVFEALERNPELRATIANVEMSREVLVERQLARLSRSNVGAIHGRRLDDLDRDDVTAAAARLKPLSARIAFVKTPLNLEHAVRVADDHRSDILLLDYIQRLPPEGGAKQDRRAALSSSMDVVRAVAEAGLSVIVVLALARSKDKLGRATYEDGLVRASFSETSALEYGADDAYLLTPAGPIHDVPSRARRVSLLHVKSRYGDMTNTTLLFERAYQSFRVLDDAENEHLTGEETL